MTGLAMALLLTCGLAPDTAGPDTALPAIGDADGDGYTIDDGDCDDDEPRVHPGGTEVCLNGIDEDCAGGADDTCFQADWDETLDLSTAYTPECAAAVESLLFADGEREASLDVWRVLVIDSTSGAAARDRPDRRAPETDSRSCRHPRGEAAGVACGDADRADDYDAGAGSRYLYVIARPETGRILGYYWSWQGEAGGDWRPMGRLHWAIEGEAGCGRPMAAGSWAHEASWAQGEPAPLDPWDDP